MCSEASKSVSTAGLFNTADVCTDCGHNKSCCAERQDQEFGGTFGEEISLLEIPVIKVTQAIKSFTLPAKVQPGFLYLNKAPPDDLVSLHQKLLV